MKKLIYSLIAAAGVAAAAPAASAQDLAAPSVLQSTYVGYDLYTVSPKDASSMSFNGITAAYQIDFKLSQQMPLYLGTGLGLQAVWHNKDLSENPDYDDVHWANIEAKYSFVSLNFPLNLSYRAPLAQGFYLTPMLGLNLRVNVSGKCKTFLDDVESRNINLFDDADMDGQGYNRVQFGWHAGMRLNYNQMFLGLQFGTDFTKLHKNIGASTFLVSLGINF